MGNMKMVQNGRNKRKIKLAQEWMKLGRNVLLKIWSKNINHNPGY